MVVVALADPKKRYSNQLFEVVGASPADLVDLLRDWSLFGVAFEPLFIGVSVDGFYFWLEGGEPDDGLLGA